MSLKSTFYSFCLYRVEFIVFPLNDQVHRLVQLTRPQFALTNVIDSMVKSKVFNFYRIYYSGKEKVYIQVPSVVKRRNFRSPWVLSK